MHDSFGTISLLMLPLYNNNQPFSFYNLQQFQRDIKRSQYHCSIRYILLGHVCHSLKTISSHYRSKASIQDIEYGFIKVLHPTTDTKDSRLHEGPYKKAQSVQAAPNAFLFDTFHVWYVAQPWLTLMYVVVSINHSVDTDTHFIFHYWALPYHLKLVIFVLNASFFIRL